MQNGQRIEDEQNKLIALIRLLIVLFVYGSEKYDALKKNELFFNNPWEKLPQLYEGGGR